MRVIEGVLKIPNTYIRAVVTAEAEWTAVAVRVREKVHVGHQIWYRCLSFDVSCNAQGTVRHSMVPALERNDASATSGGLHQLDCRFDSICT